MSDSNKVIIVVCEGQHDIAFIVRMLLVSDFTVANKKIRNFISPFNSLFEGVAKKSSISDLKLGYQNPNYLLPSVALEKNDGTLIFIHNLNGDGRGAERKCLVDMYLNLIGDDDFTIDWNYKFRFLFFFDADELGVRMRLNNLSVEMNINPFLENGVLAAFKQHEVGCYVYHDDNSQNGVLEDILLKHFSNKSETLIESIDGFFNANELDICRTKEFSYQNGLETYKGPSKYYIKKSKINLFGQLQFSGMSNSVIIAKTDFLKSADISECEQCQKMISMFR